MKFETDEVVRQKVLLAAAWEIQIIAFLGQKKPRLCRENSHSFIYPWKTPEFRDGLWKWLEIRLRTGLTIPRSQFCLFDPVLLGYP